MVSGDTILCVLVSTFIGSFAARISCPQNASRKRTAKTPSHNKRILILYLILCAPNACYCWRGCNQPAPRGLGHPDPPHQPLSGIPALALGSRSRTLSQPTTTAWADSLVMARPAQPRSQCLRGIPILPSPEESAGRAGCS